MARVDAPRGLLRKTAEDYLNDKHREFGVFKLLKDAEGVHWGNALASQNVVEIFSLATMGEPICMVSSLAREIGSTLSEVAAGVTESCRERECRDPLLRAILS